MFMFNKCNKNQEFNSVNLMSWFFLCFSSRKLLKLIKFYRFQYSNSVNLMYCLFSICFSSRKIVDILTNTNNLVYSILFMFFILFHMINNFVNLLFFNQCNNIDYIIVLSVYFLNLFIYLFSYNFVQYLFDIFKIYIPIHS